MTELTPDLLLHAYRSGIFPMAEGREDSRIFWLDPVRRGIIPLNEFHVPRTLAKSIKKQMFDVRCDSNFSEVIAHCAMRTRQRRETWINDHIIELYSTLHTMGHAHCVECRHQDKLVGGLYGIAIGGAFFGESMFSQARDASKVALSYLIAYLRKGGFRLLDTQFVTPHLRRFGAIEITRAEYHRLLASALDQRALFPSCLSKSEVLDRLGLLAESKSPAQSTTQTS